MPIDWAPDEPAQDDQRAFEIAAIDAAKGYLDVLDQLHDALERERKLKAQIAALIGIN